jgi:hypothetical protein
MMSYRRFSEKTDIRKFKKRKSLYLYISLLASRTKLKIYKVFSYGINNIL